MFFGDLLSENINKLWLRTFVGDVVFRKTVFDIVHRKGRPAAARGNQTSALQLAASYRLR